VNLHLVEQADDGPVDAHVGRVVLDDKGEVLGVVSMFLLGGQNLNFAIGPDELGGAAAFYFACSAAYDLKGYEPCENGFLRRRWRERQGP
jgi:hypothetical protein